MTGPFNLAGPAPPSLQFRTENKVIVPIYLIATFATSEVCINGG